MPRIPEYRAGGTQTIPGPGSIPVPRATPNAFGAMGGRMLEQAGRQVSDFALKYLEKKTTENANIYVSKALSEARTEFTQDFVQRRSTATGDISADFDAFMRARSEELIAAAPNDLAISKTRIGLNQMMATFNSKSIIFDDSNRQARSLDTFSVTHNNRLGIASSDFSQLPILLAENLAEGNKLLANVDPLTREKTLRDNGYAIGESAIKGLITSGRSTNDQAIKLLSDSSQPWKDYLQPGQAQKLLKEAETQRRTYLAEDRAALRLQAAKRTEFDRVETDRLYDIAMVALADPTTRGDFAAQLRDSDLSPSGKEFIKRVYRAELQRDTSTDILPIEKNLRFVNLFDATENVVDLERLKDIEKELQLSRISGHLNDSQYKMLTTRLMRPTTQQEKIFLATIKAKLVKANPMTGFADPEGYRLYGEAVALYEQKKTELTDKNIPIGVIFDPKSEHHQIVKDMNALVRNPLDVVQDVAKFSAQQEQAEEVETEANTPAPLPENTDQRVTVRIPESRTTREEEEEDPELTEGRRRLGLPGQ